MVFTEEAMSFSKPANISVSNTYAMLFGFLNIFYAHTFITGLWWVFWTGDLELVEGVGVSFEASLTPPPFHADFLVRWFLNKAALSRRVHTLTNENHILWI